MSNYCYEMAENFGRNWKDEGHIPTSGFPVPHDGDRGYIRSRSLRIRNFSIGPAHDPYGATEFWYSCNGDDVVLYRDGLFSISVRHNGKTVFSGHCCAESSRPGDQDEAERVFAELTGLTYSQFNRAYEKLNPPELDFEDPMGSPSSYM